jgi:membrane protease YdiL (CAAX protease family)
MGTLILLAFLFAVNLKNTDVLWALGFNIIILGISYLAYSSQEYQDELIGINGGFFSSKTLIIAGWGILFTFVFYLATLMIPGLSLGYPLLPGSISTSFKWFLVNIVSPLTETIFFLGVVLAFFNKLLPNHKWLALTIDSIIFAMFHLGAYILGFYAYPSFTEAMPSILANASAFIVAFLFNLIAGSFILTKNIKNLIFGFVFHQGINIIAWIDFSVTFISNVALAVVK